MNTRVFESFSDKETFDIAFRIANNLKAKTGSVVVCLDGDLGVGKTVFAKGFGAGLGIKRDIVSPTFNIVKSVVISKDLEKGFDYRKIAVEGINDEDFGN